MSARYLIRFDDICPTCNWTAWYKIEKVLIDADIKPILAVIPDNRDESLKVNPPDEMFWDRVRAWQTRGWTIGLHGYQHRYVTCSSGLLKLNRRSEFAGLCAVQQEAKLRSGIQIFKNERVTPDLWIAPAHSFDGNTIAALKKVDIGILSDGYAFYPHQDSTGMIWIPQQLWRFHRVPFGVWTICLHANDWTPQVVDQFRLDVLKFRKYITSVGDVLQDYMGRRKTWLDVAESELVERVIKYGVLVSAKFRQARVVFRASRAGKI